jgi:MOSC domain-containing protein YiiM
VPAANVHPETGVVDANLPFVLRRARGHIDCGVFVRVCVGGEVGVGDPVTIL